MSVKEIGVIGKLSPDPVCDGQAIKTLEIVRVLCDRYGEDNVRQVSYFGIKDRKFKLLFTLLGAFRRHRKIVLCARGMALNNLVRACYLINKPFRRPIYFVLIGGALAEALDEHPTLMPVLASMKGIFVETDTVAGKLRSRGLENVYTISNFKHVWIVPTSWACILV